MATTDLRLKELQAFLAVHQKVMALMRKNEGEAARHLIADEAGALRPAPKPARAEPAAQAPAAVAAGADEWESF